MSTEGGGSTTVGPTGPAKTVLRELIAEGPPRTAGELWAEAEKRGIKSKRFMKTMLKQMRERGEVRTRPPAVQEAHVAHSFRYTSAHASDQSQGAQD